MSETAIAQLQKQLSYRASDGRDWCDACNCEEPLPNHTDDCPFTALRAQKPREPVLWRFRYPDAPKGHGGEWVYTERELRGNALTHVGLVAEIQSFALAAEADAE